MTNEEALERAVRELKAALAVERHNLAITEWQLAEARGWQTAAEFIWWALLQAQDIKGEVRWLTMPENGSSLENRQQQPAAAGQ